MDLIQAAVYHRRSLERLGRSEATLKLYDVYENSFLTFLLEHGLEPTLETLTPDFVRRWQSWLRSRSRGRRGGVVSERQGVMTLKTWAHFLMDNDVYDFDPLGRLKVPRVAKIQRKPFNQDEVVRLTQAAASGVNPIRDRALLLILLDTGARIGEMCAATLADLDVDEGTITFTRTKGGRPRTVRFRVPGQRDGGPALVAMRQWLKIREARDGVNAIFTTRERWPLSARRAREIFADMGERGRVPDCHPHRCRHTAASEFLAERPGAELQLRSRLGHVSREVLSDYVSISDPTAAAMAEVASISNKWHLGSRTNGTSQPRLSKASAAASAFCTGCGRRRVADDRFCAGCGRALGGQA